MSIPGYYPGLSYQALSAQLRQMDQPNRPAVSESKQRLGDKNPRRRHRPRPAPFQMRVSTKFAPRRPADGKPLGCTTETSLKPEQMFDLYRYLKLTRLVEERLVNLYRQTKVVGGVFRSLGQEATAVGSAYALAPQDLVTSEKVLSGPSRISAT